MIHALKSSAEAVLGTHVRSASVSVARFPLDRDAAKSFQQDISSALADASLPPEYSSTLFSNPFHAVRGAGLTTVCENSLASPGGYITYPDRNILVLEHTYTGLTAALYNEDCGFHDLLNTDSVHFEHIGSSTAWKSYDEAWAINRDVCQTVLRKMSEKRAGAKVEVG